MNLTLQDMVDRGYLYTTNSGKMGITSHWVRDGIRVFLVRGIGGPTEIDAIASLDSDDTFSMECKGDDTDYVFPKEKKLPVKVYRREWVEITEREVKE